jgi:hypothetical protein
MTAADKPTFAGAFARLAVAFREKAPDAVQLRVYFDGLQDQDIECVVAAADRLMSATFFPKLGEWRAMVATIDRERTEDQRAWLRRLPEPLCAACSDTGWCCVGPGVAACECRELRRLEVLGRRVSPLLAEATLESPPDTDQLSRATAMAGKLARQHRMPTVAATLKSRGERCE